MKRSVLTFSLLIFAILLACSVVEVVRSEQQYFPLDERNTWVYEVIGLERVDTIICKVIKIEQGIYSWDTRSSYDEFEPGQASIMGGTIVNGSEPFDDSGKIVVDSALGLSWNGVGDFDFRNEDPHVMSGRPALKTPMGTFDDYVIMDGIMRDDGTSFEVWLVSDIGPVQIYRWKDTDIIQEYRLIEFISAF
ncbi:hypothetical protein JXM67_06635 [candidate division WOR-3 bacterium]|nr:hypothetical protein [candidate division WOR-3 bacterium]